jgi:Ca2+/Na+ antiporter
MKEREINMNERTEAVISFLAALLVLFSAMLDPRISLGLAIAFLVILAVYKFLQSNRRSVRDDVFH